MRLDLWSEPKPPNGAITAEGVLNQLGRPGMTRLQVLVREALQNSWDARDGASVVDTTIALTTVSGEVLAFLRDGVLPGRPIGLDLDLDREQVDLLAISDRGTTGLGGPTRADRVTEDHADFADFLRNVGQPPDKEMGGGTYGFGKAALFLASRARTLIVQTRCRERGGLQDRTMGIALGSAFEKSGVPYTGRHWWGVEGPDGVVEPAIDDTTLVGLLDMPDFGNGCGTTIILIDPDLSEHDDRLSAMEAIREAVMWNLWPKLMPVSGGSTQMRVALSCDGQDVELPHPLDHAVAPYARALEAIDSGEGAELYCQRPKQLLGRIAFSTDARDPTAHEEDPAPAPGGPQAGNAHHVALMRTPRLVVEYVAGDQLSGYVQYGGAFLAETELDRVFARAEPPTHDRWEKSFLVKHEKRFVNVTYTRIREAIEEHTAPARSGVAAPGPNAPLGAFADRMGGLLPGTRGTARAVRRRSSSPGGVRRSPSPVSMGGGAISFLDDGTKVARVRFSVSLRTGVEWVAGRATVNVLVAGGGTEKETPHGLATPGILGWTSPSGRRLDASETVKLDEDGEWFVDAGPVDEIATSITVRGLEERTDGGEES